MKKRLLALSLALALCLGLAVPAFAADTSAEVYTYISDDFPYAVQNFEGKTRAVNGSYEFDEAKELRGSFPVVPTSEYFRVGVYNMGMRKTRL